MKKVKFLHLALCLAIFLLGGYLISYAVHKHYVGQLFFAKGIWSRPHGSLNGESDEWADKTETTRLEAFRLYSKNKGTPHFEEFVPYLNGENPEIVEQIVRIIGRSENPQALVELSKLQNNLSTRPFSAEEKEGISHFIAFSMARINTRELKGIDRVNRTLAAVGLNFSDVVQQSHQISDPRMGRLQWASVGGRTVRELLQMIYSMEKRGERNEKWYQNITAREDYFRIIEAARLPEKEGILHILDYMAHIEMGKMPGDYSVSLYHLLTMKNQVPSELRKELEYVNSHRSEFPLFYTYDLLFNMALRTDDKKSIPIIEAFQNHKYESVRTASKVTVKFLKGKKSSEDYSPVCMDFY